jgi:hypothetical protein
MVIVDGPLAALLNEDQAFGLEGPTRLRAELSVTYAELRQERHGEDTKAIKEG